MRTLAAKRHNRIARGFSPWNQAHSFRKSPGGAADNWRPFAVAPFGATARTLLLSQRLKPLAIRPCPFGTKRATSKIALRVAVIHESSTRARMIHDSVRSSLIPRLDVTNSSIRRKGDLTSGRFELSSWYSLSEARHKFSEKANRSRDRDAKPWNSALRSSPGC